MTTTRRRDRLYITIPNLFRCPISLDVMKSPVSLCTGVTYDRSSIQRWLESGHDTCPATMQVLPSKDFVPNLTLHRLITLWIQSSSSCSSPRSPISPCLAADLIRLIQTPNPSCSDALSRAVDFVNRSDANRRYLAGFDGFLEAVSGVLRRKDEKVEVLELAVRALVAVSVENGVGERLNGFILRSSLYADCFSSIDSVIQNGSLKSKIDAIRLLESIAIDAESGRRIAQSRDLPAALLCLIKQNGNNRSLTEAVISLLVKIAVTGSVISEIVTNGVVEILSTAINDDASKNVQANAMKLLGMVSRSSEGRVAMGEDARCAVGIAERLLKSSSKEATAEGVAALWRLCKDERVKEAVAQSGGLTKMVVVLQREEEGSVKRMCGDLVKALTLTAASKGQGRPRLQTYHSKTMHIMPC